MAGMTARYLGIFVTALALLVSLSGCSLDVLLPTPAAPPPVSTPGQTGADINVSLVGEEIFHDFTSQEKQVDFTVVPAAAVAVPYLDGMAQLGALDTSATDPTIKSLNLVANNFTPNDLVNVTLYDYRGTITGTVQVRATGTIDVATYNAASVRLTATTTDTSTPSPVPLAYLYQMKNSAGTTFTFTVPPPP